MPDVLRVLTLSTLFPNAAEPVLGPFVERQVLGLAERPDVEVRVVSPIGLPPGPLARLPHYRARAALPEEEVWQGLTVYRPRHIVVPRFGQRWTARSMAKVLLPRLRALRETYPFDVIDAQFFWPDGPAAVALGRALGVPVSIKARGADVNYWPDRPGIGAQIAAAARDADGLLAVSEGLKDAMVARGMPADRIRVHYTGVDLELFRPVDRAAAKMELGFEGPLLTVVGGLVPRKNQALALAALERLPGATLLLIGDGPERRALETLANDKGVARRVHFLGARPRADVAALLAAADVLLHPSTSEGLANVWVEAMACGTPVVAGAIAGAAEAIDRPAAGRIVPLEAGAFAAAAAYFIAHPPAQADVCAAAERFSWVANAAQLHAHLAEISRPA